MAKIKNIYESTCDGFITVVWEKSVSQYEGKMICPNVIKKKIDNGEYTVINGFRNEVPLR